MVLTYSHSAKCQLLFSACFFTSQEINTKPSPNIAKLFVDFFGLEDIQWAREAPGGCSEGSTTHQGAPRGPGAPWWVGPTSGAFRTASLLYKYPDIPETLGDSKKINSSRRKSRTTRSNLDTISDGVHRLHWCLSDDA